MSITAQQLYQQYKIIDERLHELSLNPKYNQEDNRRHIFNVLRMQILWTESIIRIMHVIDTKMLPSQTIIDLLSVDPDDVNYYEEFFIIARISLISNFNFLIENFFKTVLSELDKTKKPPIKYYEIVNEILTKTNIRNPQTKLDTLYTLAMIRNSFHSNGIHTKDDRTVIINGTKFEFFKGKEVTDVGYERLTILIHEIITILEEIINSQNIQKMTWIIPKLFIP